MTMLAWLHSWLVWDKYGPAFVAFRATRIDRTDVERTSTERDIIESVPFIAFVPFAILAYVFCVSRGHVVVGIALFVVCAVITVSYTGAQEKARWLKSVDLGGDK